MRIPATVKVGPFRWDVLFSEDVSNEGSVFGSTHWGSLKIFLDPTVNEQKQEEAFIHELLHACEFLYMRKFCKPGTQTYEALTSEQLVGMLAPLLYQVIIDNPEVFT